MQKVHTINLGGIIFQIEEDAYDILKNYLSSIRSHFQNQSEGLEIANDIEYRLGEMLSQKLTGGKVLIQKEDVESIISIMGQPTDFDRDENETSTPKAVFEKSEEKTKRKFFRDTDDRIIGGVSTGIAAYFGIEAWIVRVCFLISLFFGGAGFLFYLILWIAVPKAKTTADRLAMKGEKPTLDNIVKSVEERAKELNSGKFKGILKEIVDFIETILKGIFRVLSKVLGVLVLFISSILLLVVIATSHFTSTGGITINDTTVGLNDLFAIIYSEPMDILLIRIIAFVILSVPLVYLIFGGLRLLGSKIKVNKYINIAAVSVWFFALFLGAYFGIKTLYEFSAESGSAQTINISTPVGEVLDVVPFENMKNTGLIKAKIADDKSGFILSDSGLYISNIELEIEKSKTQEIELVYKASARGRNETEAVKNYKNIIYKFSKVNNQLLLDDYYKLNPGSQFRAQSVKLILKLPEGQQIRLDPFIERLSLNLNDDDFDYNIDEITGKVLMMTEAGLKCMDCEPKNQFFPNHPTPPSPPDFEDMEEFSSQMEEFSQQLEALTEQAKEFSKNKEKEALKQVQKEIEKVEKQIKALEKKMKKNQG